MSNVTKIVISGFIVLLCCCKVEERKDCGINLRFSSDDVEMNVPFRQSDVIDSVSYIYIKSCNDLGSISAIKYCNEKYYLLDADNHAILVVNEIGEIIGKISHRGRAKDEYLSIYQFDINPSNDVVCIYDQCGGKILRYSIDGNFKGYCKLNTCDEMYRDFVVFPSGKMLCCNFSYCESDGSKRGAWLADSTGEFIKYVYKPDSSVKYNHVASSYFCRINDTLVGMRAEPGNDNIYHITESGYSKLQYHLLSDMKYDRNFLTETVSASTTLPIGYYEINNYFETAGMMCCDVIADTDGNNKLHQICLIYYDKISNKEILIKKGSSSLADMNFIGVMGSAEDRLFSVFNPALLPEKYRKMLQLDNCTQPVIQVAYLKKY